MKLNLKLVPVFLTFLNYCKGYVVNDIIDVNDVMDDDDLDKRDEVVIPELTSTTCGYNTKSCNIGFDEFKIQIYSTIWFISTPIATVEETFRNKKKDKDERISMVSRIRSFSTYFDVYITGEIVNGGCINDKNNKCAFDKVMDEPDHDNFIFSLRNIEEKTPKYLRFKYSDWTGKCYTTWKVTFDIQATRDDLLSWYWYGKFNIDQYYD